MVFIIYCIVSVIIGLVLTVIFHHLHGKIPHYRLHLGVWFCSVVLLWPILVALHIITYTVMFLTWVVHKLFGVVPRY